MKPYHSVRGVEIYHGDCVEVAETIARGSVDVVLTDPPYASGARQDAQKACRGSMLPGVESKEWFGFDAMTSWGFTWFFRAVAVAVGRTMTKGAHAYWFTDWRMAPNVYGLLEASGQRVNHVLVWDKLRPGMGTYWRNSHENVVFSSLGQPQAVRKKDGRSVLSYPAVSAASRVHPTEKPMRLLNAILRIAPLGKVFDPFMGSGTTLQVALANGREAVGSEIEERYCEIAARRLDLQAKMGEELVPQPEEP